jgi:hypothetical protein
MRLPLREGRPERREAHPERETLGLAEADRDTAAVRAGDRWMGDRTLTPKPRAMQQ